MPYRCSSYRTGQGNGQFLLDLPCILYALLKLKSTGPLRILRQQYSRPITRELQYVDLPHTKDELIRLLLKGLGWCFLLEAITVTIALGFFVRGASLMGINTFLVVDESHLSSTFAIALGMVVVTTRLIGYYLLAYAFIGLKHWGLTSCHPLKHIAAGSRLLEIPFSLEAR